MKDTKVRIGTCVHEARKRMDMTLGEFAKVCGVSTGIIHRMEHGYMTLDNVQKVARALGYDGVGPFITLCEFTDALPIPDSSKIVRVRNQIKGVLS